MLSSFLNCVLCTLFILTLLTYRIQRHFRPLFFCPLFTCKRFCFRSVHSPEIFFFKGEYLRRLNSPSLKFVHRLREQKERKKGQLKSIYNFTHKKFKFCFRNLSKCILVTVFSQE